MTTHRRRSDKRGEARYALFGGIRRRFAPTGPRKTRREKRSSHPKTGGKRSTRRH